MAATAQPLLPFDTWPDNIEQADVVANDNARRAEVIATPAVSFESSQPVSPSDGEVYILSAAWGDEVEGTLAYYFDGAWTYWLPYDGLIKEVAGDPYRYEAGSSDDWFPYTTPGAVAWGAITGTLADQTDLDAALNTFSVITEGSAFTATVGTHDSLRRYIRAGGNVTFDDAQPYTAGMAFNIRATGSISLVEDGVTLTVPSGGTLAMTTGMAVTVIMTGATAGDVIGQTVPA